MITVILGSNCSGKTTMLRDMYYYENRKSCLICNNERIFNYRQSISYTERDIYIIEDKIYPEELTIDDNTIAGYDSKNEPFSPNFLRLIHSMLTDAEVLYIDEPENGITDFELYALCDLLKIYSEDRSIFITTFSHCMSKIADEIINCDNTGEICYDMLL